MNVPNIWKNAVVTLEIRERIMGGVPLNPKLIEGWIKAGMPSVSEAERAALAARTAEEVPAATEDKAQAMTCCFKRNKEDGLFIEGRQVKAMFKESANVLREVLQKAEHKGSKAKPAKPDAADAAPSPDDKPEKPDTSRKSRFTAIRAKLAERLFVAEDRISIRRDGKILEQADGSEERAIHVLTAMGPRDALKRSEFIEAPATLTFHLKWLADGVIDLDLIAVLLEHASENGIGADRSQGNGRFRVLKLEAL